MSAGRCDSRWIDVRCEREHGHGGAHTVTIDHDPDFTYCISWWPKPAPAVVGDRTEGGTA